jgi:hypothetical protein
MFFWFFSIELSQYYDSGHRFGGLTWVFFCYFLKINFLFQFYLSILSWLIAELHEFYWFVFYNVDLGHRFDRFIHVDSSYFFGFFLNVFFLFFFLQYFFYCGLGFIICFNLLFMRLSLSRDLDCRFYRLVRVDPS